MKKAAIALAVGALSFSSAATAGTVEVDVMTDVFGVTYVAPELEPSMLSCEEQWILYFQCLAFTSGPCLEPGCPNPF